MTEPRSPSPRPHPLDPLLAPRSIAVVGASDDVSRIGGRPMDYLLRGGFTGPVIPINPRRQRVQGVPALPDVASLESPVDLAIVAVPGAAVEETLNACAARGVGAAVIFSSGFAELGDDGAEAQRRLRALARDSGLRILGPNCLGFFDAASCVYATFATTISLSFPRPGPLGVVSQSGAFGTHLGFLAASRGMDVSTLITTGNECDVEFAECLEWMALHPGIDVIVAVAEGPRDGPALRRALAAARERRKPVVMLKMGRSETGAAAAASHTASLAGSDAVYDAVMEAEGVWRATDTDELLDVAYAACVGVLPASTRTGLLTVSGGGGIQLADAAERHGVAIPPMPESAQERIRSRLPYASPANPVDITAQVFNEPELLPLNLDAMLEEGDYDAVVVFFTYVAGAPAMAETLIDLAASVRERYPDRLLVQCVVAPREILARYETLGSPCFEDPDRAVRAIAALAYFARVHARTTQPALAPVPPGVGDLGSGGTLDEARSMALLAAAGLPAPRLVLATRAEEAVAAARDMGGEVALKVCDPQVVHKSDVGGVALGIRGDGTVARAYAEVCERITAARGTPPEAVLVTPMAGPGVDMILGLQRDPVFGPVVMVGVGGIFVEVLRDVRLAPAPVDEAGALSLLRQLKGWPLLCGARGRAPADVEALCRCISALSHLAVAAGERLRSVDINPLRVFPRGQGALMLDAVVIADQPGPPEQRDEDTPTP